MFSFPRALLILLAMTLPAAAQLPQGEVPGNRSVTPPRGFKGGRMTIPEPNNDGFHARPTERSWRKGHWYHGSHRGRFGWWWITGPQWFFYDNPVYPFPDIYGPAGAELGWWYWCDSYQDYYPYVTRCPSGWRTVPPR
jgi:hypothetical protein